jgi:hypothetical protein
MGGNNASVAVTLTVNTAGADGQLAYGHPETLGRFARSGIAARFGAMLGVLTPVVIFASRYAKKKRGRAARLRFALPRFAFVLVTLAGAGLIGCGGVASSASSAHSAATAPGNYAVNVNAGTQTTVVTIDVVQQ